MQFKKALSHKYNPKHILPTLCIACATLVGCQKEATHDVELTFYNNFTGSNLDQISIENIKTHAKDRSVRRIYLTSHSQNTFLNLSPDDIHKLRLYMQERMEISSKNHGNGPMVFTRNMLPVDDSLWLAVNGYDVKTLPMPAEKSR